jgi:hypothetical protein
MTWLPLEDSTPGHRKLGRVALQLRGLPQSEHAQALGHTVALWLWSISNCDRETGAFPASDGCLMEQACFWKGEEGTLIEILCRVGFLEQDGDLLRIHAWQEHQWKVLESLRIAAEKQREKRDRKKAPGGVPSGVPGGVPRYVPRYVPSKTDRQTDERDLLQETETAVSGSSSDQETRGEAIEEAAQILERFPQWNLTVMGTRVLVADVATAQPEADLPREARAWCEQVLDKGAPRDCAAAFRGWMKKARAV